MKGFSLGCTCSSVVYGRSIPETTITVAHLGVLKTGVTRAASAYMVLMRANQLKTAGLHVACPAPPDLIMYMCTVHVHVHVHFIVCDSSFFLLCSFLSSCGALCT